VFAINADATGDLQLTGSTAHHSRSPRWSPNGKDILFGSKNPPVPGCGRLQLWTMKSDGSDTTPIHETAEDGGDCGGGFTGGWSPDGTRLVYSFITSLSNGASCAGQTEIRMLDLDTRESSVVADAGCYYYGGDPAWRPATN